MEKSEVVVPKPVEEEKKDRYRFEESFSRNGPDNEGWNLNEWDLHDTNHTGENSKSLYGEASSNFGTVTKHLLSLLHWDIQLFFNIIES